MTQRRAQQFRTLDALIRVYSPPRRVRILFWNELMADLSSQLHESCTNACNNRPLQPELESTGEQNSKTATTDRASRRESKRMEQQRWAGSVVDALSDVFTAIWVNFVEPTDEFRTASELRPGSSRPRSDAKLVSTAFSSDSLMAVKESYRIHFQLMQQFRLDSVLSDWRSNPAVQAYINHMRADQMIQLCCEGLFKRLGTPGLETVIDFVDTLGQTWFQPVANNEDRPRCGYYHVCVGEFRTKSGKMSGMHNWFKFLIEEEKNSTRIINWLSYEKNLHLISMSFNMKHPELNTWFQKDKSSFLVGVPIDFELLLFTVIAMVNPNHETRVRIKDYEPLVAMPRTIKKTGGLVTAYFRESPKGIEPC